MYKIALIINTRPKNNYQNNSSDEIEKLYNLKKEGIITQDELNRKKSELL
jgi:hypothetical protein